MSAVEWEPMPYWEFICGSCDKGLFMTPAPQGGALHGECRNRDCANRGLVVEVRLPTDLPTRGPRAA